MTEYWASPESVGYSKKSTVLDYLWRYPPYNPANYGRYSVCLLSPGVSYPPVYGSQPLRVPLLKSYTGERTIGEIAFIEHHLPKT